MELVPPSESEPMAVPAEPEPEPRIRRPFPVSVKAL